MGSVDKGFKAFRGKPMAAHVVERLKPQVGRLMINANQNLPVYRDFGVPVWPDEIEGFAGPLAGLHAALEHCETEYLATAPCDSPFLPNDLVARLAEAMSANGSNGADVAVAVTGTELPRQRQPVFCLVKTSLAPHLELYLKEGGRKVDQWFSSFRVEEVYFEDEDAFRNINTLEDLRRFETT
jgi:molybdopterin-guanine dinucleotide biosynthesis protein A